MSRELLIEKMITAALPGRRISSWVRHGADGNIQYRAETLEEAREELRRTITLALSLLSDPAFSEPGS